MASNDTKQVVNKTASEAIIPDAKPETATPEPNPGIPCICVQVRGRWFCMKEVDDTLIRCDGPFATKAQCEAHKCYETD